MNRHWMLTCVCFWLPVLVRFLESDGRVRAGALVSVFLVGVEGLRNVTKVEPKPETRPGRLTLELPGETVAEIPLPAALKEARRFVTGLAAQESRPPEGGEERFGFEDCLDDVGEREVRGFRRGDLGGGLLGGEMLIGGRRFRGVDWVDKG